jgi:DNA-binding HxlR family transcriptional regulator
MKVLDRLCDLISLIRKQPRTKREIRELWPTVSKEVILTYMRAMHEEGLIYVREYRRDNPAGQLSAVWAWQPEPHFYPDAKRVTESMEIA